MNAGQALCQSRPQPALFEMESEWDTCSCLGLPGALPLPASVCLSPGLKLIQTRFQRTSGASTFSPVYPCFGVCPHGWNVWLLSGVGIEWVEELAQPLGTLARLPSLSISEMSVTGEGCDTVPKPTQTSPGWVYREAAEFFS